MNEFKKAKEILEGNKKIEGIQEKLDEKVCDRSDKMDISVMRRDSIVEKRKKILDNIIPGRICPSCKRRIYLDSSWFVKEKERFAICRSCYSVKNVKSDGEVVGGFINGAPIIRFPVDGWKIMKLREKVGVGIKAFASKVGWTKAYQYQIERGSCVILSIESVERIISVFEEIGVNITDTI